MSMLAEPRRKQKWTLNPRGKQWSDDSNKFGQKMLEKMGWSQGKGLGLNEQGMTEHVRVSVKNDTAGMGFDKSSMDHAWTEHQDSFNDFLQELQKNQGVEVPEPSEADSNVLSGKSLELKSKESRARVHYQKFTRGKDVNKYSSKDLANIFGQKDLNVSKHNVSENVVETTDSVGIQDNRGGVITINGGNMVDYFMKKSQNHSESSSHLNNSQSVDTESETEYCGFGYSSSSVKNQSSETVANKGNEISYNYAFENPCLNLNSPNTAPVGCNASKVSKKRKSGSYEYDVSDLGSQLKRVKESPITETDCRNGFVNTALNLDDQPNENCNGKEFEVSRAQFGLANSALDLTDEADDKKRVRFNDHVEYSTDSTKKKKGKSKLDKFEVENKKLKKNRKQEDTAANSISGFVNEALDIEEVSEEINDNELNERKSRKSKKKKERKRSHLETIEETPEEDKDICENGENIDTIGEDPVPEEKSSRKEIKKKKKQKKEKTKQVVVDNQNDTVDVNIKQKPQETKNEEEIESDKSGNRENNSKESKKKKKKKKDKNENEPVLAELKNTADNDNELKGDSRNIRTETAEEEVKISKASKKKAKKDKNHDVNMEQEVHAKVTEGTDKENANTEQETVIKKKKSKKDKKHTKSEELTLDTKETVHQTVPEKEEALEKVQTTGTPIKKPEISEISNVHSPWNETARMSKRLLKSLFHRNSVSHFPGSNIHDIKGYGVDVE